MKLMAMQVHNKHAGVVCIIFFIIIGLYWPAVAMAGGSGNLQDYWAGNYRHMRIPFWLYFSGPRFEREVLAKARPDGCYFGLEADNNREYFARTYPDDLLDTENDECPETNLYSIQACQCAGGTPKVNQAYVWGLAKYRKHIWFGTVANTHCLVLDTFFGGPGFFPPNQTGSWACDMSDPDSGNPQDLLRDARPPRIFMYDLKSDRLVDKTPDIPEGSDRLLLLRTAGIRSAGAHRKVVFLGGIGAADRSVQTRRVVNLFAFNAQTGEYLGAKSFDGFDDRPHYNNIRQWQTIKGQLYTGVGTAAGGEILRWTGRLSDDPDELFQFEAVGKLSGDPAYLVRHKNRIFVSTWGPLASGGMALYMSPKFGRDRRLTADDRLDWKMAWQLNEYEVEPTAFQAGGALASFGGYLYWGTMHVPGLGLFAFNAAANNPGSPYYGASGDALKFAALGTYRPIMIFRGKNFDNKAAKSVEVLYGNSHLPKYNLAAKQWEIVPNNMGGQKPKFGLAGFNNFFNNYTWTMGVYKKQLFVGTMDWLYLLGEGFLEELTDQLPAAIQKLGPYFYGADLWRFPSPNLPAVPVSLNGVGNHTSYGVRTMLASRNELFLGMANPMNLLTDTGDDLPEGGWELIRLKAKRHRFFYRFFR